MTGCHIRKDNDKWSYPDHSELFRRCRLLPMSTYLERRRGTLRQYMARVKPTLLAASTATAPPAKHAGKILWWQQSWLDKNDIAQLNRHLDSG